MKSILGLKFAIFLIDISDDNKAIHRTRLHISNRNMEWFRKIDVCPLLSRETTFYKVIITSMHLFVIWNQNKLIY